MLMAKFENVCIDNIDQHRRYKKAESRLFPIYKRDGDIRSPFARDYNRIIHCFGFRRLKHKTQVFFHPYNDHVCTRMEHALHVAAISMTICKELGLNTELANAIAIGHDLGHAPFGHHGESVLDDLWRKNIEKINVKTENEKNLYFWHEKNSLFMADSIETVKDDKGFQSNLNLTYAVRDGIICHCGEHEVKNLIPREKDFDLTKITEPGITNPYTWEGCVVRVSDIISYLGRDIEDAEMSDIVDDMMLNELKDTINKKTKFDLADLSNGVVIHKLILDLCKASHPKKGLSFSEDGIQLINIIKNFDYKSIYRDEKIGTNKKFISLVLETIFNELKEYYDKNIVYCLLKLQKKQASVYQEFVRWLERYHEPFNGEYENKYISGEKTRKNIRPIYNIKEEKDYMRAIIHYMSGFTDNFALSAYDDVKSII